MEHTIPNAAIFLRVLASVLIGSMILAVFSGELPRDLAGFVGYTLGIAVAGPGVCAAVLGGITLIAQWMRGNPFNAHQVELWCYVGAIGYTLYALGYFVGMQHPL